MSEEEETLFRLGESVPKILARYSVFEAHLMKLEELYTVCQLKLAKTSKSLS